MFGLDQIVFWHWLVFGTALAVLEMLVPGVVFLWMGIAAGITGIVLWIQPDLTWELQLTVFAILSVISTVAGRILWKRLETESDHPTLNRRGVQYVGRTFTLTEAIINGFGKINVDDTTWKICGSDLDVGATVRVVGVDGVVLKVEKLENSAD